ncbi:alpha-ketoglutarate-dependent dioxygenase AlkB family protein [Sediminitomix flava]|uniref:Alkylated DNA repair dioxygenase AlkB n=1 Tax=Sediminitomix flava TaxID=379075 RepID=A0A315ZBW6_SEDFL|nr:alpha-ketoglutarate-dependent dioxygenase AlkB [Sediminitomix flava]PWJ42204.1 alkylated DNA repair dioxygenase AlkB [Sediminitomix flava]
MEYSSLELLKQDYWLFEDDHLSLRLYPHFYDDKESLAHFDLLKNTIDWKTEKIKIFGKEHLVPRVVAWQGEEGVKYKYSGVLHKAVGWSSEIEDIKNKIESETRTKYNSVLLNRYRGGSDKMGWHSDDEKELGVNPVIASLTFGAVRRFDFKEKVKENPKSLKLHLPSGSLLIMEGETQHYWKHQIPQQKKVEEERINLTFRLIKA